MEFDFPELPDVEFVEDELYEIICFEVPEIDFPEVELPELTDPYLREMEPYKLTCYDHFSCTYCI